jgi:hypothetical protein
VALSFQVSQDHLFTPPLGALTSGGLPSPKGARAVEELRIGTFSGRSCCEDFSASDSYIPLLRNRRGFLKLVELCKGLVVVPCLVSSAEMNGKSRSLGKWVTRLVGKDATSAECKTGILAMLTFMRS